MQRLTSKHKSLPVRCTDETENKGKNFRRRNLGNCLYLLMMMIDGSTTSLERQMECLSMDRLENEISLTYLPRSQSTLMRKCVAEQILGNWLETFSTYLEIYSLDVEVIVEFDLNELKHFGNVLSEGSEEGNRLNSMIVGR